MHIRRSGPPGGKRFTLYWSSMTKYENCGQSFLWSRGWGTIDCGGGPGKRKPKPMQRSEHHAIMGIVLANFWEWLYNDEEWKHPVGLVDRLLEKARKDFSRLCLNKFIDWRLAPSRDEMWDTIEKGIRGYIRTMKAHKLLGPYARSEVDLTCYVNKWTPIGGRADLILRRSVDGKDEISILDGKNSRRYKARVKKGQAPKFMTYTDPDQLRWYALCFYLSYKRMPDRLGFIYFRYPYGQEKLDTEGEVIPAVDEQNIPTGANELESGVEWIEFDRDDLKGIATRARDAVRGIQREKFEANPVPSQCKFCDYETVCSERQAQKKKNRRNKKSSDAVFDGMDGFVKFGMGPGGSVVIDGE
jgi:hypothetical protein